MYWARVQIKIVVVFVVVVTSLSLQCRRIFGKRTLSTSSRNVWSLSWILKAEEGLGEIEIFTKGVIDR